MYGTGFILLNNNLHTKSGDNRAHSPDVGLVALLRMLISVEILPVYLKQTASCFTSNNLYLIVFKSSYEFIG